MNGTKNEETGVDFTPVSLFSYGGQGTWQAALLR